jgi:NAD+ kinase
MRAPPVRAAPIVPVGVREDVPMAPATTLALTQLGLVVHPRRDLDGALEQIRAWAAEHDVRVGQVPVPGQERRVAEPVAVEACELIVSLGGDGTTLAALHAGAAAGRPFLGVACGSIGALTAVTVERIDGALEHIADGRWTAQAIPALRLTVDGEPDRNALNDVVVVRDGGSQVVTSITVDGVLYARVAGDGLVVGTPLGSSAYTMAAGGPLLAPGAEGFVVTPLAAHGGSFPPLVVGPRSRVSLTAHAGFGGLRYEVDGRPALQADAATVSLHADYATRVALAGEEPWLTGLRRRGLVADSPRVLVHDGRDGVSPPPGRRPAPAPPPTRPQGRPAG